MVSGTSIKCFLSLAETLNFTKTAASLYLTQQAVSKSIGRMEEMLGFPLFVRDRHSVRLTEGGERCLKFFTRYAGEYDALVRDVRLYYEQVSQKLHIGYQNWLDFGNLPARALTELRKETPQLLLNTERHSPVILRELLEAGKMDLIVLNGRFAPKMPGTRRLELVRTPLILLVSPEHRLSSPSASLRTFVQEPFIFDAFERESSAETKARAAREAAAYGLRPREIIVVPNRDSAYTAAEMGQGVIVTTGLNRILSGTIMIQYSIGKTVPVYAIWRESRENALAERYARCLRRQFQVPEDGGTQGEDIPV